MVEGAAGTGPSGPTADGNGLPRPAPPGARGLALEVPPTPQDKAAANGTKAAMAAASTTTVVASARGRSGSRLLGDSLPAVVAEETRPPCYLETASLLSVLTFRCVGVRTRVRNVFWGTEDWGWQGSSDDACTYTPHTPGG